MRNAIKNARVAAAGLLAAVALTVAGCDRLRDDLLTAPDPDIIQPSTVTSADAAEALRVGVLTRVRQVTAGGEGVWMLGGLFTDEWKSSDTFSQRNETDQRSVQESNGNVQGMYRAIPRVRNAAREALNALVTYQPDSTWKQAQMFMAMGLAELMLAENFCNGVPLSDGSTGVPVYGPPLTNAELLAAASAHFDTALAKAVPASLAAATTIATTSKILQARAKLDLGQGAAAAALVNGIATTYTDNIVTYSLTTADNQIWSLNNSAKRWTVGDSFDVTGLIKNAIPFASANDPRLKVTGSTLGTSASGRGFDGSTNLIVQGLYARSDAAWIASGLDARLIEAEVRLQAQDIPGTMAILNALRTATQKLTPSFTSPVMAALATPATQDAAVTTFFREKAFWQFSRGFRLNDLRRQMRQYNRTQDNVFPTGSFFKGGNYGSDVNFPVTTDEYNNPNFKGCLDRKP